jgi:hypothetical protein
MPPVSGMQGNIHGALRVWKAGSHAMQSRKSIFTLSLFLAAVESSGAPPQPGTVLNRQQAEVRSPASILRADGESPLIQRGDDSFERPADEEKEFTRRLNRLQIALHDFSTTYNSGHVIDVKKVRAVRKAWVELEKSGWFRAEKLK